ncbi:hypothetical protein MYX84_10475 [Acidobacteria bacterium AH-259-O06]|nr:hypothetical protein [Acidobacteria bacterium AH-259-O06]
MKGKKTRFLARGSPQTSEACEQDAFTVQREVSLYGDNDISDYDSRKQILEEMSRDYLANFGAEIESIKQMNFLEQNKVPWRESL